MLVLRRPEPSREDWTISEHKVASKTILESMKIVRLKLGHKRRREEIFISLPRREEQRHCLQQSFRFRFLMAFANGVIGSSLCIQISFRDGVRIKAEKREDRLTRTYTAAQKERRAIPSSDYLF
jgi:hypothetical protein